MVQITNQNEFAKMRNNANNKQVRITNQNEFAKMRNNTNSQPFVIRTFVISQISNDSLSVPS